MFAVEIVVACMLVTVHVYVALAYGPSRVGESVTEQFESVAEER